MPEHITGTREEWLSARTELLALEKEHARRGDELARMRLELPWVRDREGVPLRDRGRAPRRSRELFDGRSQLLVYHLMFGVGFRVRTTLRRAPAARSSQITSTPRSHT